MSSPTSTIPSDRLQALEAKIAQLESQLETVQAEIVPWHVICAAVAAVMPDVRIVRVTPVPSRSLWRSTGLLRHVDSHRLR